MMKGGDESVTQCERDFIEDSLVDITHQIVKLAHDRDGDVSGMRDVVSDTEIALRELAYDIHRSTAPIDCGMCLHQSKCKGANPNYETSDWHHVGYRFVRRTSK